MRLIFLCLIFGVLNISNSKAQTVVDISSVGLISNSNKKILLGENISKAIDAFGQPGAVNDYEFEIEGKRGKEYTFLGNKLYFIEDKLFSYEITNNSISIGFVNNKRFKTGDKIETIPPPTHNGSPTIPGLAMETYLFLSLPVTKKSGTAKGFDYSYYAIYYLKNGNNNLDSRLELYFNSSKTLINAGIEN